MTKMVEAVMGAVAEVQRCMDAERDAVPRSRREPYFDKCPRKGPDANKHIVGYRTKLLRAQARAAIAAMRQPTEGMLRKGHGIALDRLGGAMTPLTTWQAMIDAALQEGE